VLPEFSTEAGRVSREKEPRESVDRNFEVTSSQGRRASALNRLLLQQRPVHGGVLGGGETGGQVGPVIDIGGVTASGCPWCRPSLTSRGGCGVLVDSPHVQHGQRGGGGGGQAVDGQWN